MSFTAIRGGLIWPERTFEPATNTVRLLDASGERWAVRVTIPKTGTLAKYRFRTGTVTTGDTLRTSFQDSDGATGDPDGTQDQYTDTVIANGDDNVYLTTDNITADGTTGGTKRSVTRGDYLWIVQEFPSYVAGNLNLYDLTLQYGATNVNYCDHYTAGAWAKLQRWACGELIYDDGTIEPVNGLSPAFAASSTSINNTTSVREQGNYFQVPVAMKVSGIDVMVDLDGDCDAILYDSDGTTVLGTAPFDKDNRATTGAEPARATFAADVTLSPGVWYRMVWKPTSATSITGREYAVNALASFDAMPGGQFCYWTQKSDAGVWSETNSKRARIALVVSEISSGAIIIEDSMQIIPLNNTTVPLVFAMRDSAGEYITGLSPTVTLSKNGGAFASPSGAVAEIGSTGKYTVAANATDANTAGSLVLNATGAGAIPVSKEFHVASAATVPSDEDNAAAVLAAVPSLPVAVPVLGTANLGQLMAWVGLRAVHKFTQTSTEAAIRNAADNANLFTAPASDDNTTFLIGPWSTP